MVAPLARCQRRCRDRQGVGGGHLRFGAPPWTLPSAETAPDIDLKGESGMVVAPPSRHASGTAYAWEDPGADLAELPDWISHRIRHPEVAGASNDPTPPFRTSAEQGEFASTWAETGIELLPGDATTCAPFTTTVTPRCTSMPRAAAVTASAAGAAAESARSNACWVSRRRHFSGPVCGAPWKAAPSHSKERVRWPSWASRNTRTGFSGGQRRYGGVDVEAVASLHPRFEGVEVRIHDRPVDYMAPADAARLATDIEGSISKRGRATCRARIRGGWDRGGDDVGLFGVVLYLGEAED